MDGSTNIKQPSEVMIWQLSLSRLKITFWLLSTTSWTATIPKTSNGHFNPHVVSSTLTEKICIVDWRSANLQPRSVKAMGGISAEKLISQVSLT